MKRIKVIVLTLIVLSVIVPAFAQNKGNENSADRALRGSGRVNPSSLAMEFSMPLGSYPGRGIDVPISLSYSSKLWRADYTGHSPIPGGNFGGCHAQFGVSFSEDSAAGWTTSLATPYIEYTGKRNIYWTDGGGVNDAFTCETGDTPSMTYSYVRRLIVHLPSGETHEMRADDAALSYSAGSKCVDDNPNTPCDPNDPSNPGNWDLVYYAVDGSNIKYVQNSGSNTFRLLMPDGSYYDFDGATPNGLDRKAVKYTDRNGNHTDFHAPDANYPNGYWTDTLGRTISVPIGLSAPAATAANNPQIYSMPGMTGSYKFHWKKLKGDTAEESALTDFNQDLRYRGNRYGCQNGPVYTWCINQDEDTYLFGSQDEILMQGSRFNPVVLAEIELPTGQKYKFTYDVFGRIERIHYPTGGEERFEYGIVKPLSSLEPGSIGEQTNSGVVNRKVYETAGQGTPYEWTYSADHISSGYQITTTNPDNTLVQRLMHRGGGGLFGYEDGLTGMAYKEEVYDNASPRRLVSRKLTNWTKTDVGGAHWHPRVASEESQIFDSAGNGVSATVTYNYEGDLSQRETPVLMKKSSQYAFVSVGSAPPSTPVRSSESTFLINDPAYSSVKDYYKNQNIVGLVTSTTVRNGAGTVVHRTEMKYDEDGYSPNVGRGNPTMLRTWDSTKGNWDDPAAYIQTRARFDSWGNQYEAIDAKGNATVSTFDSTYHAFPIQVTSTAPDPSGQHGTDTAFVTTATFDPVTGLPLTTTDANGLETRIAYDPVTLRPLNTKTFYQNNQVGGTSETVYHDETNNYWVKSRTQIDTDKWAESIAYFDGLGRAYKSEEISSQGSIFVDKEFDSDGRVLRVSNPYRLTNDPCYQNNQIVCWTTNVYDEASRIKEVVLQDGARVKTDYGVSTSGVVGVTKQITDQAGKKRKGISDALGRMVRVIEDPDGQNLNTDYVFDTLGNLRKTTQGEQNRYFTYDSLGRLLYAKQPEQEANTAFSYTDSITNNSNWSVKYEYDDNGNITKTTDARGVFVQGTYDKFNRLKTRDYSDATPDVGFFYDGTGLGGIPARSKGKTTKVSSSVSETRYTSFDELGRLLTSEQRTPFGGETAENAMPRTFTYQYNMTALVAEIYPSGRVVNYEFDRDGDLARVGGQTGTGAKTYANSFSYNSAGGVEAMRLGNGKWETTRFNSRMQVEEIGLGNSAADKSLLKLEYGYGNNTQNNGSMRSQKISFSGLAQAFEQSYTYDSLNRLYSAEEKVNNSTVWKQTFDYDRYGNREFDAANTTTLGQSNKITNPQINTSDNRLKEDQDNDSITDYDYDENGSLTLDAVNQRYVYDAENRIKDFFAAANNTTTPDAVYQYDGAGKRVKKITPTEIVVFIYDGGGQLAAEYSTQTVQSPATSYLTNDHLGSPRIITNQTGQVVARHDYSAFGDETFTAQRTTSLGYKADNIRQDYTGYQKDEESGLEYAQARYYNSSQGRFTSVDPLTASANAKDPQTFNRYSYGMNSPYKFTDPLGLISSSTGSCAQWCPNSDGSFGGGMASSYGGNFANENEIVMIDLNIVYNPKDFTLAQAKEFLKDTIKDLKQTFSNINVQFNVTYSEGDAKLSSTTNASCANCAYEITKGAKEGAVNAYLYDNSRYQTGHDSRYNPNTGQIFISRGGTSPLKQTALSHEMGHLFRHFSGYNSNTGIRLTIDNKEVDISNFTEDAIIDTTNSYLRNFNVTYGVGNDYVDDYTTSSFTRVNGKDYGNTDIRSRKPTALDLYRLGARRVAAQRK